MTQTHLTRTQDDFLKQMTNLIETLNTQRATIINTEHNINQHKQTMARVEEKLDTVISYLIREQQEKIKQRENTK